MLEDPTLEFAKEDDVNESDNDDDHSDEEHGDDELQKHEVEAYEFNEDLDMPEFNDGDVDEQHVPTATSRYVSMCLLDCKYLTHPCAVVVSLCQASRPKKKKNEPTQKIDDDAALVKADKARLIFAVRFLGGGVVFVVHGSWGVSYS